MKEKNNQDIDFLFNLLTKHNFRDLIWNVAHESNDEIFKQKLLKIRNYWKPLLDGYHKFLLPPENELFISLKTAFDKLPSPQKFAIIQNNLKFGVFLKANEISGFLKSTTDNWKYFALTFVEKIENINLREFEINGSLNQIGRLLLKNKQIKNRESKIEELYNFWSKNIVKFNFVDNTYLSYEELYYLWQIIHFKWKKFLSQNENNFNIFDFDHITMLLKNSNIKSKNKRQLYKRLNNLKIQTNKKAINSGELETVTYFTSEGIQKDIQKKNLKNPFEWISIIETSYLTKAKNQNPLFDFIYQKPVFYQRELNMPLEYYYFFNSSLQLSFSYYFLIMKNNLKSNLKLKLSFEIEKLNSDFYYFINQQEYFFAGMLAIAYFKKTISQLFPWLAPKFQEETCTFWNVCKIIKNYMNKDYQYFIELTFYPESDKTTFYLNARNKLFHFDNNFLEVHAFAIYTLAIENFRIINAKIPIEYYKNWKFSKKGEIL